MSMSTIALLAGGYFFARHNTGITSAVNEAAVDAVKTVAHGVHTAGHISRSFLTNLDKAVSKHDIEDSMKDVQEYVKLGLLDPTSKTLKADLNNLLLTDEGQNKLLTLAALAAQAQMQQNNSND